MKYLTAQNLALTALSFSTSASAQYWASTTTYTFSGPALPTGLIASSDLIQDISSSSTATYNHQFNTSNVQISDNFLHLIVPGNQTSSPVIQSAEISTAVNNILYASVRTSAILTNESGICNGMFFYHSDSQEIDIEWISDPLSASNDNGTRVMQYTNQGKHGAEDATEVNGDAPQGATEEVHEYRVDWVEGSSRFFVDGEFQREIEMSVPTTGGQWVWNAWSNGDPEFTVGPPKNDAVFKIQKIVMMYNTTDDDHDQQGSSSKGVRTRPVLHGLGVIFLSIALTFF